MVDIKFDNGEPSYNIIQNSAWDFIDLGCLQKLDEGVMLYHGSLALRNDTSAKTLNYIKEITQASVFVDINLREPWWKTKVINEVISNCRWLKLNEEELAIVVSEDLAIEDKMKKLLSLNALDLFIVTQGEKGGLVSDSQGGIYPFVPKLTTNVVDTVGAGDSFSSVILLGQYKNWPLDTTLQRAQQFASAVVCIQGATINDKEFYQPYIDEWEL